MPARTLFLVFGLIALAANVPALAAKRIALVIGNAKYESQSPLNNPSNDADLIAGVLKRDLQFSEVIVRKNLGRRDMGKAISELGERARGADAVFVYYSGHGMQRGGQNYLIPVDAVIKSENDIDIEGIATAKMLGELEAAGARVTVVVLDACRNNPFSSGTKSLTKGLARIGDVSDGMLIAYATRDGFTAEDGRGSNSPYALALAEQLRKAGQPVRLTFEHVADQVRAATGGQQRPVTYGDLRSSTYLASPSMPALATAAPTIAAPLSQPASTGTAPSAPAPGGETVRREVFALVDPSVIKTLMSSKRYDDVQQRVDSAAAVANLTPYESYVIERTKLALAASTGNDAMSISALEAVIASNRLTKQEQADFMLALGNFYYNGKQYGKTIEWVRRYQRESTTPDKARTTLARAYYLSGDFSAARSELLLHIDAVEKGGKTPSAEDLRLLASSAAKLKDTAGYAAALEKLVMVSPTDEYWNDLLRRAQSKPQFNQRLEIDALRLQDAAMATMVAEDYVQLAELALMNGFPAEAKAALDRGFAAKVLGTGQNGANHARLRDKANAAALDDVRTIEGGIGKAQQANNGTALLNTGYALVTMEKYAQGIALMEQAIAKGGLKSPQQANLRLGMAYAKAGRSADARRVFAEVRGDAGESDLARYWILWLDSPGRAATQAGVASAK